MKAQRGILRGLKKNPRGESTYDSLLERNYMIELERTGGVVSWTKDHGIRIPYKMFGFLSHYYEPDFLVTYEDGTREIHETKGAGFLLWLSTHAKRRIGDEWCRKQGMTYRFIENSGGSLFGENRGLDQMEAASAKKPTVSNSLDELLGK